MSPGRFLFPEGDKFVSPGLCGNALPWEMSGPILLIPEGDEHDHQIGYVSPSGNGEVTLLRSQGSGLAATLG